jgi:hypothetical protein
MLPSPPLHPEFRYADPYSSPLLVFKYNTGLARILKSK